MITQSFIALVLLLLWKSLKNKCKWIAFEGGGTKGVY